MLKARVKELESVIAEMREERLHGQIRPKGPAEKCWACGATFIVHFYAETTTEKWREHALKAPRSCTSQFRVKTGWFSRCDEYGDHMHEECKNCGHKWTTAFAG